MKALLMAAYAVALASCASSIEADRDSASRVASEMLEALVATNGVPGMSAAYAEDGVVIWSHGAGMRDRERALPATADTVYRFASVSKLVTATAAVRLWDEGQLDLDAPVQASVSGLNRRWPAMSARQLASHTSGLPHYQDIDADRGDVHFDSVHDSLAVFADRELLFAPGSGYNYSSFGFTLLSAYIEARAGQPFLEYIANEITTGLDIEADRGPSPSATVAYEFVSDHAEAAPPHDYSYSWGGAGLRGSAPDLARFGLRVLDSAFLSRTAREAMFTPATMDNGAVAGDRDFAVGIGWRLGRDHDGHPIAHHAGIAVGARSVLVVFPRSDASIAVLSNAAWSASIEQTALMLAAPFREGVTGPATPCPTETVRFDGVFDETPIQGAAGFELDQGLCRGWIAAENAFGVWLNALPQGNAARLPIISVAVSRSLERAALVTPAGIYDLRRTADGYAAAIGSSRRLTLQLRPATGRRATEPSEP